MLAESATEPLFVRFNNHLGTIFQQWKDENSKEYGKYIKENVNDLDSLKLFVKSIAPTISSSTRPEPYKASINKDSYDWICKFVDVDYIYGLIENYNSDIKKFENAFNDDLDVPTEDQRLRQFEYWYLNTEN